MWTVEVWGRSSASTAGTVPCFLGAIGILGRGAGGARKGAEPTTVQGQEGTTTLSKKVMDRERVFSNVHSSLTLGLDGLSARERGPEAVVTLANIGIEWKYSPVWGSERVWIGGGDLGPKGAAGKGRMRVVLGLSGRALGTRFVESRWNVRKYSDVRGGGKSCCCCNAMFGGRAERDSPMLEGGLFTGT